MVSQSSSTTTPMIQRRQLFGNPDRSMVRLSPDGERLAFLSPVDGVLNVWVGPRRDPAAARPVTRNRHRGIQQYFWAYNPRHMLYIEDHDGDENWHLLRIDLDTLDVTDLTPMNPVKVQVLATSHHHPDHIVVGLNDRDERLHDVYSLDITTGERTLLAQNDLGIASFVVDHDHRVRLGIRYRPDGALEVLKVQDGVWDLAFEIPPEDTLTTAPFLFDGDGTGLYLVDSRGRDTGALMRMDMRTGASEIVIADERADIGGILAHPRDQTLTAASFTYDRLSWKFLDPRVEADFARLGEVCRSEIRVVSQTLDDELWVVAFFQDAGPVRYEIYDRSTRESKFLFFDRKHLGELPLVPMHPVIIHSRDGHDLVSYLTLPLGESDGGVKPRRPLPMVLLVHGGPWARDEWGYDPEHQLWANRGYAVLAVNFRGSTGFGKRFLNAGNKEWGARMHDDLIDAVEWAVANGIADRGKIAIMGGSYGGYATLVGLTLTPEVFACGVDIVGPSSIETLLSTIPPDWEPMIQLFKDRVGDHTTEDGRRFLADRSPLSRTGNIQRPLLIAQGANDPRVKQSEADQIVKVMHEKKIPVTYVLYPDEGHGFVRPENRFSFYAITESFLARHLGGRAEEIGEALTGSTLEVRSGIEEVPGLGAACAAR